MSDLNEVKIFQLSFFEIHVLTLFDDTINSLSKLYIYETKFNHYKLFLWNKGVHTFFIHLKWIEVIAGQFSVWYSQAVSYHIASYFKINIRTYLLELLITMLSSNTLISFMLESRFYQHYSSLCSTDLGWSVSKSMCTKALSTSSILSRRCWRLSWMSWASLTTMASGNTMSTSTRKLVPKW